MKKEVSYGILFKGCPQILHLIKLLIYVKKKITLKFEAISVVFQPYCITADLNHFTS